MAYVYVLQDQISKKYYIGSCVNLEQRLRRHENHTGGSTTKKGKWKLVRYSQTRTIEEARILEKKVKSYKGQAFKKIIFGELAEWPKAPHC